MENTDEAENIPHTYLRNNILHFSIFSAKLQLYTEKLLCTNGSGGQSSCQCSCIPPPDNGWVISYSLPDDSNVSEAKRCLGCPTPTPTPTPCPTPNTPAPSANCSWDSRYCTWNCDYAGGGCTTPGWDGSCPYGTYPNNGMCCTGGCDGAAAAPDLSAEPSDSIAPGDGGIGSCNCDALEAYNCTNSGGWWDDMNCGCNVHSPIVVDVAGNGFNLTASGAGVSFDLSSDGTPERLS